jgi:hypothetical protein
MRKNWSVFLGVLAFAQTAGASEYLHPSLTSKAVSLHRLGVMPAHIEIAKSGVKGKESMTKESAAVADEINMLVRKVLSSRGFAVLDDPVRTPEASESGDAADERRATIASLQGRFDTLAPQLLSKPREVTKGRYSLGDEVAGMSAETADGLVFVTGAGVVTTASRAILLGTRLGSALLCHVVVMDAKTGDILFVAKVDATPLSRDITVAAGDLEKPLAKSFEKLPLAR